MPCWLPSTLCQRPLFCCRFFCRLLCGKRIKFFLSVAARISRKRQKLLLRLLQTQLLLCRRTFLPVKFLIRRIARRLRLLPLFLRRLYRCFADRIFGKGRRMRMCQGAGPTRFPSGGMSGGLVCRSPFVALV